MSKHNTTRWLAVILSLIIATCGGVSDSSIAYASEAEIYETAEPEEEPAEEAPVEEEEPEEPAEEAPAEEEEPEEPAEEVPAEEEEPEEPAEEAPAEEEEPEEPVEEAPVEEEEPEEPAEEAPAEEEETEESMEEASVEEEEQAEEGADEIAVLAASYSTESTTAPDWIGTPNTANAWQIVAEGYNGNAQANKQGYDIDNDGQNDLYYQKNVVSTGVENEFLVYLGITKQMTWDELLAESTLGLTTQGKWSESDVGSVVDTSDIGGNKSNELKPGQGSRNYLATIYLTRSGRTVHTFTGWFNGTTPNASNCTGYILLNGLNGKAIIASVKVNLHNDGKSGKKGNGGNGTGGTLEYTIDLDKMESSNIHFSVDDVTVNSVTDTMGDYIDYEAVQNCDGTTGFEGNTLTWTPESNGVTSTIVEENGGVSGYYYNVHQLVYKVRLNVEKEGFRSCAQNMDSAVGEAESYLVNQQAVIDCQTKSGKTGQAYFQVPYVRGLLYDIEFQKVVKDSKVPLAGVTFTVAGQEGKQWTRETDATGWIKFHNLPCGTYTITETSYKEDDTFQNQYLDAEELNQPFTVTIGKTANPTILIEDHGSGHDVDQESDVRNLLYRYKDETVENTPYTARVTIRKVVSSYDDLTENLKNQSYTVTTKSAGQQDVYLKPETTATELTKLENQNVIKHQETVTYDLLVPKDGGTISIEEAIPDDVKDQIMFESISSTGGTLTMKEQGCELKVSPEENITVTITNTPVGTVQIKKITDNYTDKQNEDSFIIKVKSTGDNGEAVNTDVVLKHDGSSGLITIKETTTLELSEILPKEYTLSHIDKNGTKVDGNQVTVSPGENVVITVHNQYSALPFFHAADAISNMFKRN